jgi:hypothetical protein
LQHVLILVLVVFLNTGEPLVKTKEIYVGDPAQDVSLKVCNDTLKEYEKSLIGLTDPDDPTIKIVDAQGFCKIVDEASHT